MRRSFGIVFVVIVAMIASAGAHAGGGFLRMDHRLSNEDPDVWQRRSQWVLLFGTAGAVGTLALWEGGADPLGKTSWQSLDAAALGGVSSLALKHVFRRERPLNTDNPDHWFGSGHDQSFPSGEVTAMAAMVTPYVLQYGHDYPLAYGLELLPLLDGYARMRVRGHWQNDVLAGFALGSAAGYFSHNFEQPIFLSVMPHGIAVGLKTRF